MRILNVLSLALGSRVKFDEALPDCQDRRLRAIVHLKLVKDVADVVLHGFLAQVEIVGNFLIGLPLGHETQHGNFSLGQVMLDP